MRAIYNVVVIDLEPSVRSMVAVMFKQVSVFSVRETDCPIKASRMYAAQEAHLIVTEFQLRMPGDKAMRLLRDSCPLAKVLIAPGFVDENVQRWVAEEGFGLLPKPFTQLQLLAKSFNLLHA